MEEEDLAALAEHKGWVSAEEREKRIASLEAKRNRLVELCIEGYLEKAEMQRRLEPVEEELADLHQSTPPETDTTEAIQKLLQEGIVPAQVWPTLSSEERRHLVVSLLQDPLEVEVGEEDGRLRLFANTCLYAQVWEAWETADATRPQKGDSGGRIACAVRARD